MRFGDVVKDVKLNVDRSNNPYEYYVAGDHMDSEDLNIRRRGRFSTDDVGPAFIRIFKRGQVLYGSRRTYLKKVAVADFDGICANTTFVFETKDPAVFDQRLLPFLMLSDGFTNWSVGHSKGSTNPYVLFSDLAEYEFELPSIEEQRHLAEKLWAAYEVKQSYLKMIKATREMVQSQFIEMFGATTTTVQIKDVCFVVSGKSIPTKLEDIQGNVPYIKVADFNLPGNEKYIASAQRYVAKESSEYSKMIPVGSVVFAKNGAASLSNKKRLTKIECCIDMNTMAIIPRSSEIMPEFLFAIIQAMDISAHVRQGAIPSISPKSIEDYSIVLPSTEEQNKYVTIVQQADKSEFELRKSIDAIDAVIKSLINS